MIPQPAAGEDGPLAVPVFAEEVTIPGPRASTSLPPRSNAAARRPAGRLTFQVSEAPKAEAPADGGGRGSGFPRAGVAEGPKHLRGTPLDKARRRQRARSFWWATATEPPVTPAESRRDLLRARRAGKCGRVSRSRRLPERGTIPWAGCR